MKFTNISENELKTISGGRTVDSVQTPLQILIANIKLFLAKFCSTGGGGGSFHGTQDPLIYRIKERSKVR